MLFADVPLQVVQPGRTFAPPLRVLAVRVWAEAYCPWRNFRVPAFAVLLDVLAIFPAGGNWAFNRFFMRLEVLAGDTTSIEWENTRLGSSGEGGGDSIL